MVIGSVNFYTTRTVSHREKIERRKGGTFFQKHQCTPFVTTTKWLVVWSCFFSSSNLKKKSRKRGKEELNTVLNICRVCTFCVTKKKKWTTIIQHENSINYYHFPQLFLLVFGSYQSDLPMCVCVIAHTNKLNQIFLLPFGIFKLWYK